VPDESPEQQASDHDAVDRALLAAHLDGDPHALDDLLRRHRQRMWAVAVRTLGHPEDAADAVQDACLSAFRAAGSFRGDARVSTWLHRIVVNACLDRIRRQAVRPTVPLPDELPADGRDVLSQRETGIEVQAALAALPVEQRAALVLVELTGMSVEDAAQVLEVPAGTVKSRCFRGRARLAVTLAHLRNPDGSAPVPPPDDAPEATPTQDPDPSRGGAS
jgi:RNA polymerase sigma-70 factor (ECF subfamily)